jgi:hypothetical protein
MLQLPVISCQLPAGSRPGAFHWQLATHHWQLVHPCFCLCFVFVQMTRTIPLRRTILQFSQIRRTLLLTFMMTNLSGRTDRRID